MSDPAAIFLATNRLALRQFRREDAEALVALDSDREVMRHISRGEPTPREHIEQIRLPAWIASFTAHACLGYWAAELRETHEFVGWFHLRPDRFAPDEMELGYRLVRAVWGQGLGTEGARGVLERAFQQDRFDKVCARALVANVASRRVMEKCGLTFVEEFIYPAERLRGWAVEERRAVKYGTSRRAWLRRRLRAV